MILQQSPLEHDGEAMRGEGVFFSEPVMLHKSGSVNQAANEGALGLQHIGQG